MITRGCVRVFARRHGEQPVYCFATKIGHFEKRMGCWWFVSNGAEGLVSMMDETRRGLIERVNEALCRPAA